jgi:hypothetical protein
MVWVMHPEEALSGVPCLEVLAVHQEALQWGVHIQDPQEALLWECVPEALQWGCVLEVLQWEGGHREVLQWVGFLEDHPWEEGLHEGHP